MAEEGIDAKIHSPANLGVTSSGRLPAFRRVPGGGTSTRRHAIGRKVLPIATAPREVLTVFASLASWPFFASVLAARLEFRHRAPDDRAFQPAGPNVPPPHSNRRCARARGTGPDPSRRSRRLVSQRARSAPH